MEGQLTFLGTGTSMGVPTLGCDCAVCTSVDPRDRRLRPSLLVRWRDEGRDRVVVIDTGPDFREQALRNAIDRVDAVIYTHGHADHILGLDDLRPLSFIVNRESGPVPLYASQEAADVLTRIYDYVFSPKATYPTRPRVQLKPIGERVTVHGVDFIPVPVMHGQLNILGFRFGRVAYLTDVNTIPESSFALIEGLDHLIISALRHKPHPSHATLDQAVEWARRIGAKQTWFTHMSHELGHEETNRMLPAGIELAYDGLTIPARLDSPALHSAGSHSSGSASSGSRRAQASVVSIAAARAIPIFRSLDEIPADFGPSAITVGNFDGVHRGHRGLLTSAAAEARERGIRSIAITFDPHPAQFLYPDIAPKLLTFLPQRLELLTSTGIDAVLVLPFDAALSRVTPGEFVRDVLVGKLGVRGMHEGTSFRFGHGAKAGVAELTEFGKEFGFNVTVHRAVKVHGMEISSSAVRSLIAAGDVRRARWMLGRPFGVVSTPARGRGIGSKLLVPTVNLTPYSGLLPGFGVYVTRLTVGERCFDAVSNVGNRPTFGEASFAVESHILDFEPIEHSDETPLKLEFLYRLRPEIEWPSPEALKAQIFKDVTKAKRYFRFIQ